MVKMADTLYWHVLAIGPFASLSNDLMALCDFLGLLVQTITFMHFSLTPVMGDIVVDMSQGLRIYARVFCML